MESLRLMNAGESALVAEFGNTIDPEINSKVHALAGRLTQESIPGIRELVPTFRSLLIYYDPAVLPCENLKTIIKNLAGDSENRSETAKRILHIPCCYGSHFGPDLDDMERYTGLTRDEIISIRSGTDYKNYMLGFLPGFVYLGGLDSRLETPRLSTPREKIPKGSVGIGGSQTGVYPLDSPGGWRLIGSTPVDFYRADREEPILCKAGEYIHFDPITSCDYYDIRQMIRKGTYRLKTETKERM